MKLRVYIAGPVSLGDMLTNVSQADDAFFSLLRAGFAPFCPHWSVFAGSAERLGPNGAVIATADPMPRGTVHSDWMGVDLPWVQCAHAVLRLPGESVGADRECEHAKVNGIPVFDDIAALREWATGEVAVDTESIFAPDLGEVVG
jgi:hypothetical protein